MSCCAFVFAVFAVNLALGRPTWQSSNLMSYNSSLAVDGNADSNFFHGSCMHTSTDDNNPWWAVDLGKRTNVREVYLTNRGDCCGRFSQTVDCIVLERLVITCIGRRTMRSTVAYQLNQQLILKTDCSLTLSTNVA